MTHTHNTDHMFREASGRYREKPPAGAWNAINGAVSNRPRKGLLIAVASAAAVIILLLGFGIGYFAGTLKDMAPTETAVAVIPSSNQLRIGDAADQVEADPGVDSATDFDKALLTSKVKKVGSMEQIAKPREKRQKSTEDVNDTQVLTDNTEEAIIAEPVESNLPASDVESDMADNTTLSQVEKNAMLQQMMTSTSKVVGTTDYHTDRGSTDLMKPERIQNTRSGWSVGGDIAAAYAYRSIQQQELVYKDRSPIADESAVPSWNAGVYASKTIAGALHVKTGVTYASYGQGSQNLYAYTDGKSFRVNSSSGNISTGLSEGYDASKPLSNTSIYNAPEYIMLDNSEVLADVSLSDPDLQVIQRFDYMEIPLIFQLSGTSTKGISITAEGGLYAGILTSNRAYLATMEESYLIGKTENLRPFSFGGIAAAGARYSFSPSLSAEIMPEIRYAFLSISNATDINYHPYQFGFGVGVTYHF